MVKTGLIGIYDVGYIDAFHEVNNIIENVTKIKTDNIYNIFYICTFQSGIERLIYPKLNKPLPPKNFISERIKFSDRSKSDKIHHTVRESFSSCLPDDWEKDEKFSDIYRLSAFLESLLEAMSLNSSLILTSPPPHLDKIKHQLPPKLLIPISNLLSTFNSMEIVTPIPQKSISRSDLLKFEDIIKSDIFQYYSRSQFLIDDASTSQQSALSEIHRSSRALISSNQATLKAKRSALGVLEVTPKIVDAAFGSLPGTLAEIAANIAIKILGSGQRIVIYDFNESIHNALKSNLDRVKDLDSKRM